MNNCTVCDDFFRIDNPDKVICDGVCRRVFHANCVNFSKDALLFYREMPNLQWFCDNCILQSRSINVSSPPFRKLNSTVVIPTSSPSYAQRSFHAINQKRKHVPRAKRFESSVLLVDKSPSVNRDIHENNDSCNLSTKNEVQLANHLVNSPRVNGLHLLDTSVVKQTDVAQLKPLHDTADATATLTRSSDPEVPFANSSTFSEVLTSSSIAEQVSANSKIESIQGRKSSNQPQKDSIQPQKDLIQSRSIVSPSETHKVAFVSNFHPSVTENEVVDYLLLKNVISSPEDVSCKKLISPYVDIDSVSFVSFKVTVNSKIFHAVVNDELWPDDIIVREFVKR